MKKLFLCFAFAAMIFSFAGCEEGVPGPDDEQSDNGSGDDTEKPEIPEDMLAAFPDPIFRAYVLENFDLDGDNAISQSEAEAVTEIRVMKEYDTPDDERIASLQGVEFFVNLKHLECYYNRLTSLDVSHNTALTALDCGDNMLTNLDVSKHAALEALVCSTNRLTSLDVSQNTALRQLICSGNQLAHLNLSKNTELTYLHCSGNQLASLDVSHNTALEQMFCHSNRLTSLDLSKNTALTKLNCGGNELTSLDVSHNTALEHLYCDYNQLTSLDLSNNTNLNGLDCPCNQLTSLDMSHNTALTYLWCYNNRLTSVDVSKNAVLGTLVCFDNQLTELDLSNNTNLYALECYSNQLTSLDISKTSIGHANNPYDYPFRCAPMETLQTLTLKEGWAIPYITTDRNAAYIPEQTRILFVDDNDTVVPDVTVKSFPDPIFRAYVLENFDINGDKVISQAEAEAVTDMSAVADYGASDSEKIKSLQGIELFTNLEYLYCWGNLLTALDVSKNTHLKWLSCVDNRLESLDLSNNAELTRLFCNSNMLAKLDISKNTQLREVQCSYNMLSALDVSKCTQLELLYCEGNLLAALDVSKTNLGGSSYNASDINSFPLRCAPMPTLQTLTLKRGWNIKYITPSRDAEYVPEHTQILFAD